MKKIISNPIFTFILGALICGTTGVVASTLMASNITYTPKDKTWGVNNVEAAIDSLKLSKTSDNYSTEEKVVGTWVDGKPLYQKTIIKPAVSNFATFETIIDAEFIQIVSGMYKISDSYNDWLIIPYSSGSARITFGIKGNVIQMDATSYPTGSSHPVILTIQYTKTTD